MRVDLPLDKKTVENQDWATGPPGRRTVAGRGPPGRSGPWAAGLFLAKPLTIVFETIKHIKNKTQTVVINILILFILIMT